MGTIHRVRDRLERDYMQKQECRQLDFINSMLITVSCISLNYGNATLNMRPHCHFTETEKIARSAISRTQKTCYIDKKGPG